MRGTKAKALRRACTTGGVLDKKAYREVKRGTGSIKRFAEKIISANRKPAKAAKPLPVAPRAGAKPMHLVRKIQETRKELGLPKMGYMVPRWGSYSRPYIQALLRDVTEHLHRDPHAELPVEPAEEKLAA